MAFVIWHEAKQRKQQEKVACQVECFLFQELLYLLVLFAKCSITNTIAHRDLNKRFKTAACNSSRSVKTRKWKHQAWGNTNVQKVQKLVKRCSRAAVCLPWSLLEDCGNKWANRTRCPWINVTWRVKTGSGGNSKKVGQQRLEAGATSRNCRTDNFGHLSALWVVHAFIVHYMKHAKCLFTYM